MTPQDKYARVIPTKYNGVEFRSRTEARWAVFFDTLEIKWVYEPEGYKLPSGTCYLPDFWLLGWNSFVEVKHLTSGDEKQKCEVLVAATGHPLILLEGRVSAGPHLLCELSNATDPPVVESGYGCFGERQLCENRLYWDGNYEYAVDSAKWLGSFGLILTATEAAVSYRFEPPKPPPPSVPSWYRWKGR